MPVIFMERSLLDSLTEADIKEIIDENEGHTKYARLEGYYEGDHDILRHTKKDSTAPNNRLVNNMAKYITDTATGYFIGKPVVYSSQNDAYLEALQDIFDYNDEQDENMELAKGASINGDCFEMLYMDEDAQIRFTKVPPDGCIYICETGYNTPMAAIRIVYSKDKDKNIIKKVEFWTAQDCWYFRSINGGALELLDIREHYWGDVPFVEYINNEERLGDFEGVITLIDAYNRVESNTANFFQYNDEALLKVLKMGAVTSQDIAEMKEKGYAVLSEGAWVIPVAEETDKKAVPPCILVKSDGSSIYATTDLATMVQRMQDWHPDKMLYVTDKRQALHFEQVFRAARKCGVVPDTTALEHIGHGTMNGKDGKPFKTRDGGVLRLETLIADMTAFVRAKVVENQIVDASEVDDTTAKIALAALKYGDLSNQPTKDYNFDLERFAAFEGNTGPYILYTIVRIKSILAKYGDWAHLPIQPPANPFAKDLMNVITRLQPTLETALASSAPNLICAYIYELAGAVNKFYHETPVLKEADETLKAGHIALLGLAKNILETCIHILGFSAPEKM